MTFCSIIKNLFKTSAARKIGEHDGETPLNGTAKRSSTPRSSSSLLLARLIRKTHSKANKDPTKASATSCSGKIESRVSQKPTESVIGHSGLPLFNQRSRRSSTTSSTISSISSSQESIQTIDYNSAYRFPTRHLGASSSAPTSTSAGQSLEYGLASASASTAPPSLAIRHSDLESDRRALEEKNAALALTAETLEHYREVFELSGATTRAQRRTYLLARPADEMNDGVKWLVAHPSDLWDTDEEEKAAFTPMHADDFVKWAEEWDGNGEWLLPKYPERHALLSERAKAVGWFQAEQESVFRKEWMAEGGMFGAKGSTS